MGNALAKYAALIIESIEDILKAMTILLIGEGAYVFKFSHLSVDVVKIVQAHRIKIVVTDFKAMVEVPICALKAIKSIASFTVLAMSSHVDMIMKKPIERSFVLSLIMPFDIVEFCSLLKFFA